MLLVLLFLPFASPAMTRKPEQTLEELIQSIPEAPKLVLPFDKDESEQDQPAFDFPGNAPPGFSLPYENQGRRAEGWTLKAVIGS